jgi:lipoyl(octanoyl) transferase
VTSHGFAFNVTTDLRDFALINPCGITDRTVTSLEREVANPKNVPSLESIAHMAAKQFGVVFNEAVALVESLAVLRGLADVKPNSTTPDFPAPEFPAQDTQVQIPAEIERLRRSKDRPVSA